MKVCLIITAAGLSSRQKNNKLLMKIDGKYIIEKTINTFINLNLDIFVVVGHQKELIISILKKQFANRIHIVENVNYKSGMASSIQIGINATNNKYEFYGFCNGDKPFINSETVVALMEFLVNNELEILVPIYQKQNGHPTFFSKNIINEFDTISGDIGGNQIFDKFPDKVTYLPVNDSGITLDMDKYLSDA